MAGTLQVTILAVDDVEALDLASAFLPAAGGVLPAGASVTTHWEDIDDLRSRFPALEVRPGVRRVDQGRIVSSAGITAGIDMSRHLVARLAGEALALRTARQMDFAWTRV